MSGVVPFTEWPIKAELVGSTLRRIMVSHHDHQAQTASHAQAEHRFKRTSSFLLGQLIVSLAGLPLASSVATAQTTCQGGASCFDMYQGTISAINTAGWQPFPNGTTQSIPANWYMQSFTGGTLTSGPMSYTVPAGQGVPVQTTLTSVTVYNCPNATSDFTGSGTIELVMSNETEITSDTEVENTSSTFMEGGGSFTIGYKPPSTTGGVNGSVEFDFDYGVEYDQSKASSYGVSNQSGTESIMSLDFNYDVPAGYIQTIPVVANVSSYSDTSWTAPAYLSTTSSPITSAMYWQQFTSVGPLPTYTSSVAGTGTPANVWYPGVTWASESQQVLASPSGAYAFWPNWTDTLVGAYLQNTEQADISYYEGANDQQNMVLRLDMGPCTDGCAGTFWATNGAGTAPTWDSNTSPAYIAMQNDGNLVGYNSSNQSIWSSKSGKGTITPPQATISNPSPTTLLPPNGQSFMATGTYAATTYDTKAQLGNSSSVAMTTAQIDSLCGTNRSSGVIRQPKSMQQNSTSSNAFDGSYASTSPESEAGYVLIKASNQGQVQLAQQDNRDRSSERSVRRDELRQQIQQRDVADELITGDSSAKDLDIQKRTSPKAGLASVKPMKLVKLKSPMILKSNQFYAVNMPGFKVKKITVQSAGLSNFNGFIPGPSNIDESNFSGKFRTVELNKIGNHRKITVKPRKTI